MFNCFYPARSQCLILSSSNCLCSYLGILASTAKSAIDLVNIPCKLFFFLLVSFLSLVLLSYFFSPSFSTIKSFLSTQVLLIFHNPTVHCIHIVESLVDISPVPLSHIFKYNLATLPRGQNKPLHVNIFPVFLIAPDLPQSNQQSRTIPYHT